MLPQQGTVRWNVTSFLLEHRAKLRPPVLEVGALRVPAWAWWTDLRSQLEFGADEWTGVDIEPGAGVDVVFDMTRSLDHWPGVYAAGVYSAFNGCVCAEVLEHVREPQAVLRNVWQMLASGAWVLVTTPFGFPVHNFPDDYWRFTPSGLRMLLENAGFCDVLTVERDLREIILRDHDHTQSVRHLPMHVCGAGRKP